MQIEGREKIVGILLLSCVGVFMLFLLIQGTFVRPVKELKKQKVQLDVKLNRLKKEQSQFKIAEKEITEAGQKMISANIDEANSLLGELINDLIQKVGLNSSDFTRSPIGPVRLKGAKEMGWTVQGEGSLSRVIDLIYLLKTVPALHRLESVRFSPTSQLGVVKVSFRYLTLVLDPAPPNVGSNSITNALAGSLDEPERKLYLGIEKRDLFRPYIKKPFLPEVDPVQQTENVGQQPPVPPAFRPEIYKAVSLSEWAGKSEIHILNIETGAISLYQPGDKIENWTLLEVDYRRLPLPNSILESDSRVILQNNEGYWSLEQGYTLAQLYKLTEEQLPEKFKTK